MQFTKFNQLVLYLGILFLLFYSITILLSVIYFRDGILAGFQSNLLRMLTLLGPSICFAMTNVMALFFITKRGKLSLIAGFASGTVYFLVLFGLCLLFYSHCQSANCKVVSNWDF